MEKDGENCALGKNDSHFVPVVYTVVNDGIKMT